MKYQYATKRISPAMFFFLFTGLFTLPSTSSAQITFIMEQFENFPVTSMFNLNDTMLINGAPPCAKASRGNAATFNTANVDFNAAQNSTFFMAANPEAPCGGFYTATILTDSMDFSAMDSVQFRCRYYKTNTLGFGASQLSIVFTNYLTGDTIESQLTAVNTWTTYQKTLSASVMANNMLMVIRMGGGEGAALDNISVIGYSPIGVENEAANAYVKLYPNPASDFLTITSTNADEVSAVDLLDLQGKVITSINVQGSGNTQLPVSHIRNGSYIVRIHKGGHMYHQRILISH